MLRPDLSLSPMRATAHTQQALAPVAQTASFAGAGFSALFGELRQDVNDFIAHGDRTSALPVSPSSAGLSAEGQWLRTQVGARSSEADAALSERASAFTQTLEPAAREAAQALGVAPELVMAHAALETGWGQRGLSHADGRPSHNLFGIKAHSGWQGDVVEAMTTEYVDGQVAKRREPFRAYPDMGAALSDYAHLLKSSPRYRGALNVGSDASAFAQALAQGGYATDPAYADKLTRVAKTLMNRGEPR